MMMLPRGGLPLLSNCHNCHNRLLLSLLTSSSSSTLPSNHTQTPPSSQRYSTHRFPIPPPSPLQQRRTFLHTPISRRRQDHDDNDKDTHSGSSSQSTTSYIPAPTWSIHELQLLQKDAAASGTSLSQEELFKLAGYAHLDLKGANMDMEALQRDLSAIISCMKSLQSADLSNVSKEEMYAPPNDAQASTPLREDVVTEGGPETQKLVLANAQQTERGYFIVPLVNKRG